MTDCSFPKKLRKNSPIRRVFDKLELLSFTLESADFPCYEGGSPIYTYKIISNRSDLCPKIVKLINKKIKK